MANQRWCVIGKTKQAIWTGITVRVCEKSGNDIFIESSEGTFVPTIWLIEGSGLYKRMYYGVTSASQIAEAWISTTREREEGETMLRWGLEMKRREMAKEMKGILKLRKRLLFLVSFNLGKRQHVSELRKRN